MRPNRGTFPARRVLVTAALRKPPNNKNAWQSNQTSPREADYFNDIFMSPQLPATGVPFLDGKVSSANWAK